jgi:hypothetical protein
MSVHSKAAVVMLIALSAIAGQARAQHVTGVVRDSASREPVPSAVVRLFDASNRELERTITGRDGRYRLDALPAGHELRVVRIGFRPRALRFPGAAARDTTLDIVLAALPTLLDAVQVDDQPRCSRRSDRAAAFALWEQAGAALLATVVARESRPPTIVAITYDRTVDRHGRIVRQKVHRDSLPTNRPFTAGRRVGEFRDDGYADGVASQRTYYGPDADALLDPAFGDGHCFSLREDKSGHPGQIGLAFEPVRERPGIVDIDGVMWVDVAAPALRTIEFRYTNVEHPIVDAQTGGFVSFRTATNGLSVIDRWNLHLPSIEHVVAAQRREGPAGRVGGSTLPSSGDGGDRWRVIDVHDVGAVIATAVWPDGSEWRAPLGTLRGRAVRPDSTSGVPGVLVWLMGSDDSTRTAADGSFELRQLLPGPYPLFAAESPADRSAFQQNDSLRIEVDSTIMPPLRLVVPTLAARIKAYCEQDVVTGPGPTLLLGNVLLPDALNAAGAGIQAFWGESALDVGRGFRARARTDTLGTFHICGLVADDTVLIKGTLDSLDASGEARFRSHRDSLLAHVILRLTVPPFRARTMRVVDEHGNPVRSASLIDDETGEVRATTDFAGEASLGWLPRGRTNVPVQRLGYEPTRVTVNVTPNDTTTVSVLMRRAP